MDRASVFKFDDYRAYLRTTLQRGERTRLAAAVRCHGAYLSRVLRGDADLSPEQALRASTFFGLSEREEDYFLHLVQLARAGSHELRAHLERRLAQLRSLDRRIPSSETLSAPRRLTYYSHWSYTATHMATGSPKLSTVTRLSSYLGLAPETVRQILSFLIETGLVVEDDAGFRIGKTRLHVESSAAGNRQHHVNWRLRAISSLDGPRDEDLHYSSVVCCARKDVEAIKAELATAVERIRAIVRRSPDEAVFCYALDLFEVGES